MIFEHTSSTKLAKELKIPHVRILTIVKQLIREEKILEREYWSGYFLDRTPVPCFDLDPEEKQSVVNLIVSLDKE